MKILPIIFSIALFCAAFLSFSVQPILGKMMLPMVGGAPSGWIVAMTFFQLALLGGYGISYLLGRMNPWIHAVALLLLYSAGLLFLPPHLPIISDDIRDLSLQVIIALAKTILIPFLALTATTAALQRVFAATNHPTAKDPYYLFVASNIGSFAGLFIYPFLLEPYIGLKDQAGFWQIIFIVVTGLICIACGIAWRYRQPITIVEKQITFGLISSKQILNWLLLAFVPCSLSMGVTNLIITDVGGLPLFWVIPLGLYLLTFVLAFAKTSLVSVKQLNFLHVIAVFLMVTMLGFGMTSQSGLNIVFFLLLIALLLGIFFIIAWACHQNLANSRPSTKYLTLYYFIIALGGGLAGLVHAFVIPFILKDVIEFPIVVISSLLFLTANHGNISLRYKRFVLWIVCAGISALLAIFIIRNNNFNKDFEGIFYLVLFFATFFATTRPKLLFVLGLCTLVFSVQTHYPGTLVTKNRNFFGQYVVYDSSDGHTTARLMIHGSTMHGIELIKGFEKTERYNVGYYASDNPIRDVLDLTEAKNIAVVGLGSGQIACYDSKVSLDYYEIDPDIIETAKKDFTYLKECPPANIFVGDGRREIQKENRLYDVIVLDAFTSDGIPLHLLTREALTIYRQHLTKNGMMLFHVSNRYLELQPSLAAVARTEGLNAYSKIYQPGKNSRLNIVSKWVVIPSNDKSEIKLHKLHWEDISIPKGMIAWTDDHSSLLQAISINTMH